MFWGPRVAVKIQSITALPSKKTAMMSPDFIQFLLKLDEAYKYQLSLRKSRPKRTLPPVPKFENSEFEPSIGKKSQKADPNQTPINAFAFTKPLAKPTPTIDADPVQPVHNIVCKIEMEEEKSNQNFLGDNFASILSQSSRIIHTKEEEEKGQPL